MTSVFIADTRTEERLALHLLLRDLKLDVVGEAPDWPTTLAQAPLNKPEVLVVDWDLLPGSPNLALDQIRAACLGSLSIVLISRLDACQQAAVSSGADVFVSKAETAERVADRFRNVVDSIQAGTLPA